MYYMKNYYRVISTVELKKKLPGPGRLAGTDH